MRERMSATATAPAAGPQINVKLIVPFVNSVRAVFSTMVKVPTTVQRPFLKSDSAPQYDVSSIIGFSGDVVGSLVISFHTEVAQKLVTSFAGMPIEPGTPDYADAIGELANMIAGAAKKDLGHAASITVPTVIFGKGHCVARLSDVPCIVIPCSTPIGEFALEVNIKQLGAH